MDTWAEFADALRALSLCVRSVQSCATVVALIVGGIWSYKLFIQRRQRFPQATLKHDIRERALTDDKSLLQVTTTISNTGEVLLALDSLFTRIQQVRPVPAEILEQIENDKDPVKPGETEVLWPLVVEQREKKWQEPSCEIEPGESDEVIFDFIVDSSLETVEVYSHCRNVRKEEIGWCITTLYDLVDQLEEDR